MVFNKKNKRKKITAIAAAALCFSSNIKASNAQEIIIVSDGDSSGVVVDPVKNLKNKSEDDIGLSSLIWPVALAAVGGLIGTVAGNKSKTKSENKSVINNSSATWIGSTIGALVGAVVGNKFVKKNVWTPVYNFFAKLFGSKKSLPADSSSTPLENPDYEKNVKKTSKILDNFIDLVVVLKFIRFSELSDINKSDINSILEACSFRNEFINETIANYAMINFNSKKSKDEMCKELKKEIYNKVKNSVSSLGMERLINNLEEANEKLNSIISELDKKDGIDKSE